MVYSGANINLGSLMARPKSNRRSVRLSMTLDEQDHMAIKKLAADMDLSAAWIVPRAVSEFIERHIKKAALPLRRSDDRTA